MFFTSLTATSIFNKKQENPHNEQKPSNAALTFLAVIFLLELVLFVWALVLAFRCGKRHKDLFLHVVFAFFFPFFYILYYFISGCSSFDGCNLAAPTRSEESF